MFFKRRNKHEKRNKKLLQSLNIFLHINNSNKYVNNIYRQHLHKDIYKYLIYIKSQVMI